MKKSIFIGILAGVMFLSSFSFQVNAKETKSNSIEETKKIEEVNNKHIIAKLRGRLLYQKNQARKMERSVEAMNPEIKEKITNLRKEIADLYISKNPKIEQNYTEQKELNARINALKEQG
ncbi:MAG: hypothetical protein WCS73_11385 [Lentisphaeria bacterium]